MSKNEFLRASVSSLWLHRTNVPLVVSSSRATFAKVKDVAIHRVVSAFERYQCL